jgi:uncharacterized protein (DUF302 family)
MRLQKDQRLIIFTLVWDSLLSVLLVVAGGATEVALAEPILTAEAIRVEHIRIVSAKKFEQVKAALESQVPQLDPAVIGVLSAGDMTRAQELERGAPLFIFLTRDHGALLRAQGGARNAVQYDIGNPLTASLMTKHKLQAGLYAPLRVVLYENKNGGATFEYDKPSTLFGQFGDAGVDKVASELDLELEQALRRAAE